jgi:hypothetical protein
MHHPSEYQNNATIVLAFRKQLNALHQFVNQCNDKSTQSELRRDIRNLSKRIDLQALRANVDHAIESAEWFLLINNGMHATTQHNYTEPAIGDFESLTADCNLTD